MRDQSELHPKISVVIPMYNCEQFVPGLFKMFSEQSFTDFEVICVIDGATDGTEEKVKKFCETDKRFRYVVRENGGAGAARNTGLDEAKGKYILWADADDLYDGKLLEKMYYSAETYNTEMVIVQCSTFDYDTDTELSVKGYDDTKLKPGICYLRDDVKDLWCSVGVRITNKLFLKDFLVSNKLCFTKTHIAEDLFLSFATLSIVKRLSVVNEELIKVRRHINKESIMSNRSRYLYEAVDNLYELYKWLEKKIWQKKSKKSFFKFSMRNAVWIFHTMQIPSSFKNLRAC